MHQDIDIPDLMRRALAQGRTTAQLGQEIGLSQPTVSRLSRGQARPARSLSAAVKLIRLVGGTVSVPIAETGAEARDAA